MKGGSCSHPSSASRTQMLSLFLCLVCPWGLALPAGRHSHKAEDDGASKAHKQEGGQGTQDGRDDNHTPAAPAWPCVDDRVGGGCRGPQASYSQTMSCPWAGRWPSCPGCLESRDEPGAPGSGSHVSSRVCLSYLSLPAFKCFWPLLFV